MASTGEGEGEREVNESRSAVKRMRAGAAGPRGATAKNASKRSTVRTAGLFGTVLVVFAVLVIVLVSPSRSGTSCAARAEQRPGRGRDGALLTEFARDVLKGLPPDSKSRSQP